MENLAGEKLFLSIVMCCNADAAEADDKSCLQGSDKVRGTVDDDADIDETVSCVNLRSSTAAPSLVCCVACFVVLCYLSVFT